MSFAALHIASGQASVEGTFREPYLQVRIHPRVPHPTLAGTTMLDWVKGLGSSRWDPDTQSWNLYALGSLTPSQVIAESGLDLDWGARTGELAGLSTIDELAWPIAKLHSNARTVLIRPRLAGYTLTKGLIGPGAVWDRDRRLFRLPAGDIIRGGQIRGGVHWPQNAIDRAFELHAHQPVPSHLHDLAAALGNATSTVGIDPAHLATIGVLPTDARTPYAYQEAGALAVVAGRRCLFDEPGVGKSAQAVYAARMLRSERTLIVVPPLLTTNWSREAEYGGLVRAASDVTMFRPGRKEPELPDTGVVVISDSMLAARPATAERIRHWAPDVMIVDEAHRMMTIGSRRSDAVLDVGTAVTHAPMALTGTPMFSTPSQMVPLLELTRMMDPIFGGRAQFLETFCRQDRFGEWHAKKAALPRLKAMLQQHVWVRRRKRDVLPQLPAKVRTPLLVDVPLTEYRRAHKDVIAKVQAWVTWYREYYKRMPDAAAQEEYAQNTGFELISQLRRAAGLAKLPLITELVADHLTATGFTVVDGVKVWNRPLIVWAHHLDVLQPLIESIGDRIGEQIGAIYGATSDSNRDAYVDLMNAGRLPVLVAGITKAGVGLTLTRSSDAIFAEFSWVPAEIIQAEDRQHRVGATAASVQYTTVIASGTLDEPIQRVLHRKTDVLEHGLGQTDDSVVMLDQSDAATLTEIVMAVIEEAIRKLK